MLSAILDFANLPDRALGAVRSALDADAAFRERVVEQSNVSVMDEGSRLFLLRPQGWQEALGPLVQDAAERAEADDRAARHAELTEELRSVSETLEGVRSQRDDLEAVVAEMRRDSSRQARRTEELEERLGEVLAESEERESQRREAVRQLKAQEALAGRRLARQRELEAMLDREPVQAAGPKVEEAPGSEPAGPVESRSDSVPTSTPDPDRLPDDRVVGQGDLRRIAASVGEVAARLDELATIVGDLAGVLGSGVGAPGSLQTGAAVTAQASEQRHAREGSGATMAPGPAPGVGTRSVASDPSGPSTGGPRRPVRLGRGLRADSPKGFRALMEVPGILVLVDGYNVSMRGWPGLSVSEQRASLIGSIGDLQARSGGTWHIVFDGADDGARPAVSAPLPVRVHFTPAGLEADDRLLEFVEQAPGAAPVVVVSSDRRVRDGARERGASVVSSDTLLEVLRRR